MCIKDSCNALHDRIATAAARLLQGKHKATWAPFIDSGDHVVIVNAASVKLTGKKDTQKIYRQHSGYEGGRGNPKALRSRRGGLGGCAIEWGGG